MTSSDITVDIDAEIAVVTLNRPEKSNSITFDMLHQINEAFAAIDADDYVRVAVVTGAGTKAFCAGADLVEFIPRLTAGDFSDAVPDRTKRMLSDFSKPVIAAVNGACLAGGLELLLGTDIRIASENAVFGAPEVRHGLFAGGGTHVRLTRQIPFAVAQEMLLTGRTLTAERAREVGLVNAVVAPDELMTVALEWAGAIRRNGPLAVRAAKEAAVTTQGLEEGFRIESLIADRVFTSQDASEGPRAFLEKRAPQFIGK
ncbi:enoyl-CoA hydratase/isomerase family protein [Nocardia sp. NPDC059246]|uniref:enoyl-CoA hydratase/isomerase family protein n=1 Tax=unclassified Nocardia TaxID=2637762 RepID=UPI0036AC52E4